MVISSRRHVGSTPQVLVFRAFALCFVLLAAALGQAAAASIAFVQSNSATPQASQATVTITYTLAQTLGNLNVVVVGWNDSSATVSSVADSSGNLYALAAAPVVQASTASQAIYYAKNIAGAAAGANTVTVTFNVAARFPDIRIAEYSGLDTVNPLDVAAGTQGSSTATSDSGLASTTNSNDLLIGANVVQSTTTAAGTGFTSRGITQDGDILEDRVVTVTGSYNATASLDKVQPWIMQIVAFRAAGSGSPAPSITSLNPTSGPVGTSVTITGANFGTSQGTSTVTFNGAAATPTSWSGTSIGVPVPAGATSGNVVVTVGGMASNGVTFTVGTVSAIAFVQTNNATPQATLASVTVTYTLAQTAGNLNVVVVGWNDSTATVSSVTDSIGNTYALAATPVVQASTASQAIYYAKNIAAAPAGANTVTVTFATAARHPDIRIAEYSGLDPLNPLDTSVGAQGNTATSDSGSAATSSPNDLLVGANVVQSTATAAGTGYTSRGITGDGDILEDQVVSAAGSYNATATLDKVQLWIMQMVAFRAAVSGGTPVPNIATLSPTSGSPGTSITIAGSNFGAFQGTSTVTFNGTPATPTSWSAGSILVPVPPGATSGSVVVTVGGVASNSVNFAVTTTAPNITSLSPASGPVGTSVTITGSSFGAAQGTSTVTFNGTTATPTSWSAASILVPVPTGATTGNVVVTVGGLASNGVSFTVAAGPGIANLSPNSGPAGVSVTITGTNFGATQGTSTVTFNGIASTPTSWNASSIIAPVPVGATTGNVVVTVGGIASNGVLFTVQSGTAAIKLIQHAGKDAGSTTSSTLAFPANNTAGNWIAVAIRAGRSGQVFTVTDTRGNTYRKAVQFNVTADAPNGDTLGILYAENIAGGANTVTVADSINGSTLRFAILEYSGVAPANSLDVTAAAQGTSAAPNSGTVATTAAGDLLFSAIMTSNSATYTAGTGFTVEDRVPATSNTKLMDEDQIQSSAGNSSASASLGASDIWGAALAAFKAAGGGGATGPSISSLNPTSGAAGTPVTIAGSNFGATQGTSTVTFNGVAAASPTSWSATSIVVPVPANATSGNVVVTVGGLASNGVPFSVTVPPPNITSLNPNSGAIGISVNITGANFGASQGTSTVTFNGIVAAPTSWSATSIAAPVPNGATTGNVVVTVGGLASNGVSFTVTTPGPSISTLSMSQGPVGATVTITGTNFGTTPGTSTVTFNGTLATSTNWSATSIDVNVPAGATTGNVIVTVGGVASNGVPFTVTPPPSISSISPISGPVGSVVTINGSNFGPTVGTRASTVTFNGIAARTTNWGDTQIVAPVPSAATTGNVVVSVGGVLSNGVNFTVTAGPNITSLSPTSGPVGTSVTITGINFGLSQGASTVTFNGITATPTSWSDTAIAAPVPPGATSGNVVVTVSGLASNGSPFAVTGTGIKLIQHASRDGGITISSSLAFPASNTAGNWVAVVIRAGKSGQILNVSDSHANVYKQAILLNMIGDSDTIAIYFAENIAGGPNTVTVSDNITNGTLRFSIMEYSGVALSNSLDTAIAAEGTGSAPNSGNTVTAWGGDLLLGEIVTANAATFTAGTGYKIEDFVPSEPSTKLIGEDQIQSASGAASANASLSGSDVWGALLAAFRSANGVPPQPISVAISPATASVPAAFGTQGFTAQLVNDVQSKGVTWSLSGAGCSGSACGALSLITTTSVTYTGPSAIPSPATVTLTATSLADNTKAATATITVIQGPLTVIVNPKRGSITTSQTQQFTAAVFNDPSNSGVTWQVDSNTGGNGATGTISTSGLFMPGTQPGLHTITATSVANASVNASVNFAVTDLQGVYMHHNDPARTGQNIKEYALTPVNVNSLTFSKLFSCPVDGYVYAEPLYVANLLVGPAMHNVVFIATEHDSVYAFDGDSPSCVQLWKTSFLGTGVSAMPWQDTANPSVPGANGTDDVFPEIGITSTPVIDPATNTIYVVAKTKETVGSGCSSTSPCYISRLHALNVTTGAEKFGGPVVISAPNFVSQRHFNRPALLLANNTVYIGFGSHGDIPNWQGWLFGYDSATLARKFVVATSDPANGSNGASIWDSGAGPAADASGNIYVTTGNGAYDGTKNFSESVLKYNTTGTLLDWFTPFNRSVFDANDIDLGSAGVVILPDSVGSAAHPHLALATGKVAILYLLDQANLGKFNSLSNLDVQEVIPVPPPNTTQLDGGIYGLPAYWNGTIYTTGQNFPLSQFSIANGAMATPQSAVSNNTFPPRGAIPAVSASGSANGIVWILDLAAWPTGGPAILDAYDATNVSRLLFSSPSGGAGAAPAAVKFAVPTVANGKVYVGGQASFAVFGLLPN